MFLPKNIRTNASGLTKKLVHNPSYLPELILKSSHFGSLSTFTPFSLYNLIVSLFVGWQIMFFVRFWPVSVFLTAFLSLSVSVVVQPVVINSKAIIKINLIFVFVLLFFLFILFVLYILSNIINKCYVVFF